MRLVALVHAADTVNAAGPPFRIVGDAVVAGRKHLREDAVGLQISLIHYIDAQLIAHLQQERIGRIVRGADGVDVVFFAQPHIFFDLFRSHGIAVRWTGVMMINAVQFDQAPVEIKLVFFYRDIPEADSHKNAAMGRFEEKIVQDGLFGVPFPDGQILEDDRSFPVFQGDNALFGKTVAFQGYFHFGIGKSFEVHDRFIAVFRFRCLKSDIPKVVLIQLIEQHVSEDPVISEHILRFQIRSGAPAVNDNEDLVFPFPDMRIDHKLGCVVRTLAVAGINSVDIQVDAGSSAEKAEDIVFRQITDRKRPAVHTYKIVLILGRRPARTDLLVCSHPGEDGADLAGGRDAGRIVGELIACVYIERPVIAPELPAGGNIDRIKTDRLRVRVGGQVIRVVIELEIPLAVQAADFSGAVAPVTGGYGCGRCSVRIGNKVGARLLAVDRTDIKIVIRFRVQLISHRHLLSFIIISYLGCGGS